MKEKGHAHSFIFVAFTRHTEVPYEKKKTLLSVFFIFPFVFNDLWSSLCLHRQNPHFVIVVITLVITLCYCSGLRWTIAVKHTV